MPNPFLESPTFPWQLPLAVNLRDTLAALVGNAGYAENIVRRAELDSTRISWGQSSYLFWTEILDLSASSARVDELLKRLEEDATLAAVHPLIQEIERGGPENSPDVQDVCDRLHLTACGPFLNRNKLRKTLKQMREKQTGKPVLLVRGEPRSGKSMTLHLISTVAESMGDHIIYFYEGIATGIDAVILSLEKRVEVSLTSLRGEGSDDNWYLQVCQSLLKRVQDTGKRWWLVIDDLSPDASGQPRMDREILAFFHRFVGCMADPEFAKCFRIVLIDYPSGPEYPPTRVRRNVLEEDWTAPLGKEEVQAFVRSQLQARRRAFAPDDEERFTTELWTRAAQDQGPAPAMAPAECLNAVLTSWMGESWQ